MRNNRLPTTVAAFGSFFLIAILACSLLTSCLSSHVLTTRWLVKAKVEPGTYSVICYRDLAVSHLTTVAFLDREGDAYTIKPQTASFTYSVSKGLRAGEALKLAEQFVRTGPSYNTTEVKAIQGPAGKVLGYEVRPLYQPFVYGDAGDVLDITYFLRPKNIVGVWIRLKNWVHQPHFDEDRR